MQSTGQIWTSDFQLMHRNKGVKKVSCHGRSLKEDSRVSHKLSFLHVYMLQIPETLLINLQPEKGDGNGKLHDRNLFTLHLMAPLISSFHAVRGVISKY